MIYTNNNNRSPGGHNSLFESRTRSDGEEEEEKHGAIEGLYESFWIHDLGKALAEVANKGCCNIFSSGKLYICVTFSRGRPTNLYLKFRL